MDAPLVSLVVATYGRPDALACTLRSAVLQEHERWEAIVVGDHCGPATALAVEAVGDPRIRYYDLPSRFGEQSGPNSAGLHVARGDLVVFLNHDDLLLRDHLAHGIEVMQRTGASFYVGLHTAVTSTRTDPTLGVVPLFSGLAPSPDDPSRLIDADNSLLDPSSFWLVDGRLARAVGPWRPARQLVRTPLRDWTLRAWKAGARFHIGDRTTGVRFRTHITAPPGRRYERRSPEHEVVVDWMTDSSPEAMRLIIGAHQAPMGSPTTPRRGVPARLRRTGRQAGATLYRSTGVDAGAAYLWLRGRRRGSMLADVLRSRTGEDLPEAPSLESFRRDPERYRVV